MKQDITMTILETICFILLMVFFWLYLTGCIIPDIYEGPTTPCEFEAIKYGNGDPEQEARIYLKCLKLVKY